jgi:hypothetical protein
MLQAILNQHVGQSGRSARSGGDAVGLTVLKVHRLKRPAGWKSSTAKDPIGGASLVANFEGTFVQTCWLAGWVT